MTYLVVGVPEGDSRSGILQVAVGIELQAQARIAASVKRTHRVLEEVVAGQPELQLLVFRFSKSEVLEHGEIAVEESRADQAGHDVLSLLPWGDEVREAIPVDILMGT